jgi:hypothetical protein
VTLEELEAKLKAIGIDPRDPQWTKSKSADLGKLPVIAAQREALAKVADLLEQQVAGDRAQIEAVREELARLKRGGGR